MEKLIIPRQQPGEIENYYDEIVETYKVAFAGPPWFEQTQCVDSRQRCEGGFSPLAIDEQCVQCGLCVSRPAYDDTELITSFIELATNRPLAWWLEFRDKKLAMAALAWVAMPEQVAREKYKDDLAMRLWLARQFSDKKPIIWLDEVFANKKVSPGGNLRNFASMNNCFSEALGVEMTAYRTITPEMVRAARRLGSRATILSANTQVPDRRDFIIINNQGEKK